MRFAQRCDKEVIIHYADIYCRNMALFIISDNYLSTNKLPLMI